MSRIVINVENLSKQYRLGIINQRLLYREVQSWWAKYRGKDDPNSSIVKSQADNLQAGDNTFWALKDINLDVHEGDILGIIGLNGSGKSTLLKILSRVTAPTKGIIKIKGRIASLLEVGTGFHPELTGRENVYLNGTILGMSYKEISKKFDEIVSFAEVENFIDTPVKRYSSGMYVRLAFAVAAHLEPEILIIDEVLAVGDAQFQKKCIGKMEDVSKSGRTVLFVSHNLATVSSLCTKGLLIDKGCLKYSGAVNEVINRYTTSSLTGENGNKFNTQTRNGDKTVEITNLSVYSDGLQQFVRCGLGMTIELEYKARKKGLQIQFLIGIYDLFNTCVLYLDTFTIKDMQIKFPSNGKITCNISNEFSLFPGRYKISIAALLDKVIVDRIQNAYVLDIEEGDFYGSGKMPYEKTMVLVKQKWSIKEN